MDTIPNACKGMPPVDVSPCIGWDPMTCERGSEGHREINESAKEGPGMGDHLQCELQETSEFLNLYK